MRIAYVGEDIDAAKEVAAWAVRWADALGLSEAPGVAGAPEPLVHMTIYSGLEQVDLARAIAFACEGAWAPARFAGMAHVVPERHNALLGADLVVYSAPVGEVGQPASAGDAAPVPLAPPRDEETLRMDMAFLAPDAWLVCTDAKRPLAPQLEQILAELG